MCLLPRATLHSDSEHLCYHVSHHLDPPGHEIDQVYQALHGDVGDLHAEDLLLKPENE
jgi:hypothetical protein